MKLIRPSFEIISSINGEEILKQIEIAARTCYKSEDKIEYKESPITDGVHIVQIGKYLEEATSARKLISKLIENGHEAMLEFSGNIIVKFICDKGISHELVRHRIASFSQESTRYCNYNKDTHMQFIIPEWCDNIPEIITKSINTLNESIPEYLLYTGDRECYDKQFAWAVYMLRLENWYNNLISLKCQPQQARSVLPTSIKTEINVSTNVREWRHIFKLRCAPSAHPSMREVMIPLLHEFQKRIPILFDDIIVSDEKV